MKFVSQGQEIEANRFYKPDRKLRIMWNSNGTFCKSGYATQSHLIVYALLRAGFPIAHTAFYGLEGNSIVLDGLKIYPKIGDMWGADAMIHHSNDWKADVNVSFQDAWPLPHNAMREVKRWIAYVPIDSNPVHPGVWERLGLAWKVVTFAEFGRKSLADKGMNSTLIYHGVDTDTYKPRDKKDCLKTFGLPEDKYWFGMVAANKDNPPRKSFQEVLDAFQPFVKSHPEAALILQTQANNPTGFPIKDYVAYLGLQNNVFFINDYESAFKLDSLAMSKLFGCMDCLLAPSQSEGFGLPIIEAQSCGVPVITTDWTAMTENIVDKETGYLVKLSSKRWTAGNCYFGVPDTNDLLDKMEKVYKTDRKKMSEKAREYILKKYDFDKVLLPKWIKFFEDVENEVYEIDRK